MLELFLNSDSNRRGRPRSLLALSFVLALSAVACSEDTSPTDGVKSPSSSEDEEDEDKVEPKPAKTDAGGKTDATKPKDAGTKPPTKTDSDAGSKANPDQTPEPTANSQWCQAKVVLDEYCTSCHDTLGTGGAPMSLLTHADLVADSKNNAGKKVYEVVGERLHDAKNPMPPRDVLKPEELKLLDEWIAAGAPAGDDATCAGTGGKEPTPTEAWPPAECDEVYKILAHAEGSATAPVQVPVGAEIHPQVPVDAPWGTEKVQAIAFKPVTDNPKVLHHWILYSQAGAFLTGWAPGDDERSAFGKDIGMDMPTGKGSMRLDMHYFNIQGTQTEKDNSGLEVCVVKGPKLRKNSAAVTMSFASFGNGLVMAPAGASMKPITGTCNVTTTSPVHLMTASPHAHQYARHMKFTVIKKDGKEIVMHDQAFKFGEQGSYGLEPEVIIETGDKVITNCFYTNETTKNITFGESTSNEMCFNFAMYYPKGALSCGGGGLGGVGGFLGGGN